MIIVIMKDSKKDNRIKKNMDKKKLNNKKNVDKKNIDNKENNKIEFIKKNKSLLLFMLLFIIDIILIIIFARDNYANYAVLNDEKIFVGDFKNVLFGRNYIGLIVTGFIYFYGILVDRFFFKNKIKFMWLVVMFLFLTLFNMLLFYCFTCKIY